MDFMYVFLNLPLPWAWVTSTETLFHIILLNTFLIILYSYHRPYQWHHTLSVLAPLTLKQLDSLFVCFLFTVPNRLRFVLFISWYQSICLSLWHQQASVQTRPQKCQKKKWCFPLNLQKAKDQKGWTVLNGVKKGGEPTAQHGHM